MDDETKQFLREIFEEHSEKMESYLNVGREKIARLEERTLHQDSYIEVLNRLVIKGNGDKGLIIRVDNNATEIQSIRNDNKLLAARVEDLEDWKSNAQKREFWLKLLAAILTAVSTSIVLWLSISK